MNNGSSKNVAYLKNLKYEFIVKNDPKILLKKSNMAQMIYEDLAKKNIEPFLVSSQSLKRRTINEPVAKGL